MKNKEFKINNLILEIPNYEIVFWEGRKTKYCCVIPVLNEGKRIGQLIKKIHKEKINDLVDIIIIDGGSKDNSLNEIFLKNNGVKGLIIKKDKGGLSSQLRIGYYFGITKLYKGIITIDGNNKDCPLSIINFIKKLEDGYDFVQGSRFIKGGQHKNTPFIRYLAIRLIHAPILSIFSGFFWTDTTQGYRAYSANLILSRELEIFRNQFTNYELLPYLNFSAPKNNFKCIEVPTKRVYPSNAVPTKIRGFNSHLHLILILIKICAGFYSVRKK